jgi:BirA family biotin operon repressor/biotin-[acetyl-CoA-carboxylase] ligase
MQKASDLLNEKILQDMLSANVEVIYYPSIDSTNTQAKRLIKDGKSGSFLVVADEQTNGRGRQGKSFYSPKDTGIYMSYVFHPKKAFENVIASTTAAAVAVCRALENLTDLNPKIKWVNDIYIENKKVCGILCETVSDIETNTVNSVIIGIGVNISTEDFPSDIENAASLGKEIGRAELIAEITRQLEAVVSKDFCEFIDYYRSRSMIIGKEISFIQNGVATKATALEIENNGGLVVELENKEIKTLRSGEISIRV